VPQLYISRARDGVKMPRKDRYTDEEVSFIKEYAHMGAAWLAEELGTTREYLYQWGTNNGVSVKKRNYEKKELKRTSWAWPRNYRKNKADLVLRDGLRCHYCDYLMTYEEAQVDHILAKARGGSDAPFNLVLACSRCNNLKSTLCYECPEFRNKISTDCG
jgi:hypothetical protein